LSPPPCPFRDSVDSEQTGCV